MKPKGQRWSATVEEFFSTVDTEFGYLVSEHGYERVLPAGCPFAVEYRRDALCIRVSGISYGFGAHLEAFVEGEFLPLWPVMTPLTARKTTPTDKPQLDELREFAWRLRRELSDLVAGDFTVAEQIRAGVRAQEEKDAIALQADERHHFFSIADTLFRARQFAECVSHLEKGRFELSALWKARLDYARRSAERPGMP